MGLFSRQPKPPENQELIQAIIARSAQHSDATFQAFYMALLNSTLLIAEEPNQSRPILLEDPSGEVILPVFTDSERLSRVFPDAQRFALFSASEICRMALQNEIDMININPEHGPGCYLMRREMESLANGEMPKLPAERDQRLDSDSTLVPFGDSKLPSEEKINELVVKAQSLLAQELGVDEAYLILTASDGSDSILTIGLCFTPETSEETKTSLTQRLVTTGEAVINRRLKIIWLGDNDVSTIRQNVAPFYSRPIQ